MAATASQASEAPAPPQVTTTEGYYRWGDISFEWAKRLDNEYERRAVASLVHRNALVEPNHPLASGGNPPQLYIGEYADKMKQLCFSLRQIQYLQHYIHASGLTDPRHPNNLKQPAENSEDDDKPVRPVPLPAGLIPVEAFKGVTSLDATSDSRKVNTKISKANKKLAKQPALPVLPESLPAINDAASPSSAPPFSLDPPVEGTPLNYFEQVQQAITLARMGGLVGAVRAELQDQPSSPSPPEPSKEDLATGRGLFIAIYAREQRDFSDDLVLKDVGYHAVYFAEDPNEPGTYSETHDSEHWLVQEEIGFGGAPTPYLFTKGALTGGSLPIPLQHVKPKFKRKLIDLRSRAGMGPILIHSTDYDASNLFHLGIDITEIANQLDAYGEASSNDEKFWIDTARLFGEVENGQPGDMSGDDCLTTRSLHDIMTLIYGSSKNSNPIDNAGNCATFTIKIFMQLVQNWDARSFLAARDWFTPKLTRSTASPAPQPNGAPSSASVEVATFPLTHGDAFSNGNIVDVTDHEVRDSMVEFPVDDSDSDCGDFVPMVMNSDGELVPWEDDDDDE